MDFLGPFRAFGYYIGICDAPITEEDEHTRKTREAYEALKKEVHRIESEKHKKKEKALEELSAQSQQVAAQNLCAPSIHQPSKKVDSEDKITSIQQKIAERRNKIIKKDY